MSWHFIMTFMDKKQRQEFNLEVLNNQDSIENIMKIIFLPYIKLKSPRKI